MASSVNCPPLLSAPSHTERPSSPRVIACEVPVSVPPCSAFSRALSGRKRQSVRIHSPLLPLMAWLHAPFKYPPAHGRPGCGSAPRLDRWCPRPSKYTRYMYNDDPLRQRRPHTRTSQVTKVTHTQTLLHSKAGRAGRISLRGGRRRALVSKYVAFLPSLLTYSRGYGL